MRIFIASADRMFRIALQMLLEGEPDMAVIGLSDRLEGLLTALQAQQADVLLVDFELAKQSTADLVGTVHCLESPPKIIVLSIDSHERAAMLAAGADAYVSKNAPPDDLLSTLRMMR